MNFRTRHIFTAVLLFVFSHVLSAEKLALKAGAELGNSITTSFIAGGFIIPEWRVANNVELAGGLKLTSEEKISVFLSNAIKFPLKKWELSLTEKFLYTSYHAWNMQEYLFCVGFGAKVSRFDGMLGVSARVMTGKSPSEGSIFEPWNFQYNLGVSLFAKPGVWNLRLGVSNLDDFLLERIGSIIFSLKGDYHISDRWKVFCVANLRPAGNFHLSAFYYSFYFQTGFRWVLF